MKLSPRKGTALESIKTHALNAVAIQDPHITQHVTFCVNWDPLALFREEFKSNRTIEPVITITGIPDGDVQAATCAQYMNQVWPASGMDTLRLLQAALDERIGGHMVPFDPFEGAY